MKNVKTATHQNTGISTSTSIHVRGNVLPAPHVKGNKCCNNVLTKELMYCH